MRAKIKNMIVYNITPIDTHRQNVFYTDHRCADQATHPFVRIIPIMSNIFELKRFAFIQFSFYIIE